MVFSTDYCRSVNDRFPHSESGQANVSTYSQVLWLSLRRGSVGAGLDEHCCKALRTGWLCSTRSCWRAPMLSALLVVRYGTVGQYASRLPTPWDWHWLGADRRTSGVRAPSIPTQCRAMLLGVQLRTRPCNLRNHRPTDGLAMSPETGARARRFAAR